MLTSELLRSEIEELEQEILTTLKIRMPGATQTDLDRLQTKTPETINEYDIQMLRSSIQLMLKMERLFHLRRAHDHRSKS